MAEGLSSPEPSQEDPRVRLARELMETLREYDRLEEGKDPKGGGYWILLLTLVIFFSMGLFNNPLPNLLALIAVLLIHELGHFVGMKAFGYRNVRIFFIPLFGAAVSGKPAFQMEGWKEAVVVLLGPLPGLILGAGMGLTYYYLPAGNEWALLLAKFFLLLNAFNLLPFYPLDGGRLLNILLFSRNRYLESAFKILAGLTLALFGWSFSSWPLVIFGVAMIFFVGSDFRTSSIAQQFKKEMKKERGATGLSLGGLGDELGEVPCHAHGLPQDLALRILLEIRKRMPALSTPDLMAGTLREVWEKINLKVPGPSATLGLLMAHGFGVLLFLLCLTIYFLFPLGWAGASRRAFEEGEGQLNAGRPDQAQQKYEEALAVWGARPQDDIRYGEILGKLGNALANQGRLDQAEPHLSRALSIFERFGHAGFLVETALGLAVCFERTDRKEEAVKLIESVLDYACKAPGVGQGQVKALEEALARLKPPAPGQAMLEPGSSGVGGRGGFPA